MQKKLTRRTVIGTALSATGAATIFGLSSCSGSGGNPPPVGIAPPPPPPPPMKTSLLDQIGALLAPDANDVMLPEGFTSRIIASTGEAAASGGTYLWHGAPDGGAVFETGDGGWIYVSNSELNGGNGGVGVLKFDASGDVIDSYQILSGTSRNCAGGPTPWGTWLSCEEFPRGRVWECDPAGQDTAVDFPGMGVFPHEGVAVDPGTNILYMTEDRPLGLFYRFVPDPPNVGGRPDLANGTLQVAVVDPADNTVTWAEVPDPTAATQRTRDQVPEAATFNGGEGIVFYDNVVSFTTKGDNRIWAYQILSTVVSVIYDPETAANPILTGVDNVALSQDGELVISEDGGDMQIIAIVGDGDLVPLLQIVGQDRSELTGPAFSPDGKKLYFSSQRGRGAGGLTYEVSGPFHS